MDIALTDKVLGLLPKGIDLARSALQKFDQKAQYDFRVGHIEYCTNVIKKYCKARTFFVREDPQYLDEFYVPASVIRGVKRTEKAGVESLRKLGRKSIVTGTGGSGKTVFMRHLLLDSIEHGIAYPVFLELRNFNEDEGIDLVRAITSFMKDHGFPLSEELAQQSLNEGLLLILLDGFDEVVASKRKRLEAAIKKLAASSPCQIVISSRPDMVLEGWDGFTNVRIAPLELDEACELISKVRIEDDQGIKDRFIERLKSGLFTTHRYFLSNPLLLSIMLLTYGDSADIPRKFASFYEQAYVALFQQHDARKSGYRRERSTSLDIYDFARLFSAFSAITYNKRSFRFSMIEAVDYARQSARLACLESTEAEGFLQDAKQAVCLLIEDGLDLAFVHRSFQEYFVARFINEADESLQKQYIKQLSSKDQENLIELDNVLKLLHEMNPILVEENYLIPGLKALFSSPLRKLTLTEWKKIVVQFLEKANMHEPGSLSYSVKNWRKLALVLFVERTCMPVGERRPKGISESLAEFFDSDREVILSKVPPKSRFWRELADTSGSFSLKSLERVRVAFNEMVERSESRSEVIDSVFNFQS